MVETKQLIRILFFCIVIVEIYSCNQQNSVQETSKTPYEKCDLIDSLSDDSNNVVFCRKYNSKGVCIREGTYWDSVPYLFHKFYDSTGVKTIEVEYNYFNKDSIVPNQIIEFGKNGDTLFDKSHFYYIKYNKQVLKLGDTLKVDVILRAPYFNTDTMILYIDDPDDKNIQHQLYGFNNRKQFVYVTKKKGKYFIPSVLRERHMEGNKEMTVDMAFDIEFKVE